MRGDSNDKTISLIHQAIGFGAKLTSNRNASGANRWARVKKILNNYKIVRLFIFGKQSWIPSGLVDVSRQLWQEEKSILLLMLCQRDKMYKWSFVSCTDQNLGMIQGSALRFDIYWTCYLSKQTTTSLCFSDTIPWTGFKISTG